ncbi:MAG TPA: HlyD family secretion protein [Candidatus Sulfotelmatobacter sp.]|nr:HlyD family secretion protein [Candidatus Sulfotelmatobacter sp.]
MEPTEPHEDRDAGDGRSAITSSAPKTDGDGIGGGGAWSRYRRSRRPLFSRPRASAAALVVVLAVAAGGILYYLHSRAYESTDDAFIAGRIEQISPKVAGHAVRVLVDDNQQVNAGELLVQIDPRDYEARLAQAQANLAAGEAEAFQAQTDARRAEVLVKSGGVSRQQFDAAVAVSRTATARIAQLQAAVHQAELDLAATKVTAPTPGRVTQKNVEVGDYIQVGQTMMAIVPRDFWVVANFKETELTRMRPGQPATIEIDAYPGRVWKGHVDSIQSGAGAAFSLLPPENATGNYVKVVQRVPVKIVFDDPPDPNRPLGPGMSVVPTVKVG